MKNISIKVTEQSLALVKAMGSKNKQEAYEAQAALTKQMAPVLEEVINQERVLSAIFKDFTFNEDDNPTMPLDVFYDHTTANEIRFWSQTAPGGLASNFMQPSNSEIHFATHNINTAISFSAKHARQARFPVVQKSMDRLYQQLLLQEENLATRVLLQVLADNYATQITDSAATTGVVQIADFNNLILSAARAYTSWAGGTTSDVAQSITDMFVSPERMKDFRAMAYNPINIKGANQVDGTAASGVVTAPEAVRASLFNGSGLTEFYGIKLHQKLEFGPSQKYTKVAAGLVTAAGGTFNTTDDLMLGFDMTKEFAYRPVSVNGEGTTLTLQPDDQFVGRQEKIGFYGAKDIGHVVLDYRPIVALRVKYS